MPDTYKPTPASDAFDLAITAAVEQHAAEVGFDAMVLILREKARALAAWRKDDGD